MAASPQLRQAHQRLQELDRAISIAFADVPVPEGLQARILGRLKAPDVEVEGASSGPSPCEIRICTAPAASRKSSRRWFMAVGAAAAAAVLLVAVVAQWHPTLKISREDLLNIAIDHHAASGQLPWETASGGNVPPREFPISDSLVLASGLEDRLPSGVRWRMVDGLLSRRGVAYSLVGRHGASATLYVTKCYVDGLTTDVPVHAMHSTGQYSASAWQEGPLLYVLVVDGGGQAYEQLFASTAGPVT